MNKDKEFEKVAHIQTTSEKKPAADEDEKKVKYPYNTNPAEVMTPAQLEKLNKKIIKQNIPKNEAVSKTKDQIQREDEIREQSQDIQAN